MQITERFSVTLHNVVVIESNPTPGPSGEIECADHAIDNTS